MDLFLLYQYIITVLLLLVLINFTINNFLFKKPSSFLLPEPFKEAMPLISILIPARNEEKNIRRCVRSLLKQDYSNIEIIVLDDNSNDNTAAIVRQMAKKDRRVKLIAGKPLKKGWSGKSYACHQLAKYANSDYFIFTDADTLHFKSTVTNAISSLIANKLDALSIYPRQIMVTSHERIIVSFISFFVLNFLYLPFLKYSKNPIFCTGMGQFMLFKRKVYENIGGHGSVRTEILEDVHISKQVKRCGYNFMVFDGREDIHCRMYNSFSEVISGFSKFIFATFYYSILIQSTSTVMVILLFLLPFIWLPLGLTVITFPKIIMVLLIIQVNIVLAIRTMLAFRFKNKIFYTVFLHPFSIIYLIFISINSVFQTKSSRGVSWKDRTYDTNSKDDLEILNNN